MLGFHSRADGVPSLFPLVKTNVNTVSKLGYSARNNIHASTAGLCRLVKVFKTSRCVNNGHLPGVCQQARLCAACEFNSKVVRVSVGVMLAFPAAHRFVQRPRPVRITRDYLESNTTAYQACICH